MFMRIAVMARKFREKEESTTIERVNWDVDRKEEEVLRESTPEGVNL